MKEVVIRERVRLIIEQSTAQVILARPPKLNALDTETFRALRDAFDTVLPSYSEVRAVVLSGDGERAFSAGIDLSDPAVPTIIFPPAIPRVDPSAQRLRLLQHIKELQGALTAIEEYPWPVVGLAFGKCIGGGLDILACCDIRLASAEALLSIKEVDVGIVADLGSLQRITKLVGGSRTAEWALTGRGITAHEAKEVGLVTAVYGSKAELERAGKELAASLARKPPLALRGTKKFLLHARDWSVREGLEAVALYNAAMLPSGELRSAIERFRGGSGAVGAGGRGGGGPSSGRVAAAVEGSEGGGSGGIAGFAPQGDGSHSHSSSLRLAGRSSEQMGPDGPGDSDLVRVKGKAPYLEPGAGAIRAKL